MIVEVIWRDDLVDRTDICVCCCRVAVGCVLHFHSHTWVPPTTSIPTAFFFFFLPFLTWMRSFTRSMGAAAVLETAAETPPMRKSIANEVASFFLPEVAIARDGAGKEVGREGREDCARVSLEKDHNFLSCTAGCYMATAQQARKTHNAKNQIRKIPQSKFGRGKEPQQYYITNTDSFHLRSNHIRLRPFGKSARQSPFLAYQAHVKIK